MSEELKPCPFCGGDGCYTYFEYELSCGDLFTWWDSTPPDFCPNCGCEVITDAD